MTLEHLICPKCKGSESIRVEDQRSLVCIECNLHFTFDDILKTLKRERIGFKGEFIENDS